MYRLKLTGILSCIMVLMFLTTAWAKDRVAIMDFENKSQHGGWRLGRGASDILTTELVKTGKFNVMERERIAAIIKEQNLGASGRIDPATAARIGKIIGVEYIITGAITEYGQSRAGGGGKGVQVGKTGYHATVDIRMINAATGQIIFADSSSHSDSSYNVRVFGIGGGESFNEKKATEVMRVAIKNLAAKITSAPIKSGGSKSAVGSKGSETLVADVDGTIITLNNGKNAGFKTGQKVTISRKGKVIKDPRTGKVLKVKYKKIGAIKLTEVEDSYAEGEIISGSGFNVGDIVR
jgi:curli biogenesis system outer membrane secretion channel CsgG